MTFEEWLKENDIDKDEYYGRLVIEKESVKRRIKLWFYYFNAQIVLLSMT
ncbi:hypothetical protein KAX02_02810 [candidate division WOR-3 bacterium]|nr:hypothetical protein [candidate division WOR-3 bacterium]